MKSSCMAVLFSIQMDRNFFILTGLAKSHQKSPGTVECYLTYDFYAWWRTAHQTILNKFFQNIRNKTTSNFQSMEYLSCHSNQGAYATAIFVKPNAMNFSTKFQLHSTGVDFLIFFAN